MGLEAPELVNGGDRRRHSAPSASAVQFGS